MLNTFNMNILLIGGGGRENALAWKIAQSHQCDQLFIAPGNPGTATIGTNLDIAINDFSALKHAVLDHQIAMIVVGPEDPLVKGVAVRPMTFNFGLLLIMSVICRLAI